METNTPAAPATPTAPTGDVAQSLDAALSRGDGTAVERIVRELVGVVSGTGNTRAVFGEPVTLAEHRVIPVAMVQIGFGGGLGGSRLVRSGPRGSLGALVSRLFQLGFGGGGGGGIKVTPVGFICERDAQVRFEAIPTPAGR